MRSLLNISLLALACQAGLAQEVQFQTGHTHDILTVKFSPDDRQLISYSAGDGRLCLWDVQSGRLLWMTHTAFVQKATEHYNLQAFYWSADARLIVTRSDNGTYQSWAASTGKIRDYSEEPLNVPLFPEEPKKVSVTSSDGHFQLTDFRTNERYTVERLSMTARPYDVSHDATLFAEGGGWGDAAIKLTNLKTGESRFLDGHPSVIKAITYTADGRYLAVAGCDKNVYVFDVATRSVVKTLVGQARPITSVAFSPDGSVLLSRSEDGLLKAWHWREGRLIRDIKSGGGIFSVGKVSFNADGVHFLTTSDGEFTLWDGKRWQPVRSFKTKEGYESSNGRITIGYTAVPVSSAVFTNDGKRIVSAHVDGTVRIWDLDQGNQIKRFQVGKSVEFAQISPDGATILAGIGQGDELRIRLVDATDGRILRSYSADQTACVESLSLSASGRWFATSDVSGEVLLWDVNKSKPIRRLDAGSSGEDAIAFSPDGRTLAVGGRNQNLALFDVETGNKLWQLIPSYKPSDLENSLARARRERQSRSAAAQAERDNRAATVTRSFEKQIYITFDHYGEMIDPGEQRIMESPKPGKSKLKTSASDANAIWLRLHNDSPLPVEVPTQSMYLPDPKCSFESSPGNGLSGLCDGSEISVWFGLEDKKGKPIPYGFDFGSSAILLPATSVLFAVPKEILANGAAIRFDFTFQAENDEKKTDAYGTARTLRFREADLPRAR